MPIPSELFVGWISAWERTITQNSGPFTTILRGGFALLSLGGAP